MTKKNFWKIIKKVIKEVDVVLEICDARLPNLTRNKLVEKMVKKSKKKLIIVFNKADLASELKVNVKDDFVFVSCKKRFGFSKLRKMLNELKKDSQIKVGVVGYPNTGKSSIINCLVGRRKALTSPVAGFTKGVQWISDGKGLLFYDTPGVFPLEENDVRKAIIGAVMPEDIENLQIVAEKIIEMLLKKKSVIEKTYKVELKDEKPEEILKMIGRKLNYFKKGGEIDINRVCVKIINDWQRGKLRF
ncbi:MAG: GTPase [Candidatus Aenigmatarchaeota archaeon]